MRKPRSHCPQRHGTSGPDGAWHAWKDTGSGRTEEAGMVAAGGSGVWPEAGPFSVTAGCVTGA